MGTVIVLNWLSVVFAILAALFWLWSSMTKLPKVIMSGYGGSGGTAQKLGEKLIKQARRSAYAAFCAAIAAVSQALALLLSIT